jgi:hypothetical protein
MCPFCLTTVGLIVAGSVSTGGLAALAVKMSRKNNSPSEIIANPNDGSKGERYEHYE